MKLEKIDSKNSMEIYCICKNKLYSKIFKLIYVENTPIKEYRN